MYIHINLKTIKLAQITLCAFKGNVVDLNRQISRDLRFDIPAKDLKNKSSLA